MLSIRALIVAFALSSSYALAEDWPAYKHDAARSGVSGETLAFPMKAAWSHGSQAPRPAWPEPGRSLHMLDFDYAHQPIVAGGLVVFGSSADDTVRALNAATGKLVWRFTANGPIRLAPQIAGGRCYFASDDGIVYCLDAATGKETWRFRAALDDRQLIANGRLASRWPCRSGVLVEGGVVYVTAGMWPNEGVYVFALNTATGRPIWCNDTSCYDYVEYPHAPSTSFGGPAPQGHLLMANKTLVVPTGRCAPAAFDTADGKLLHFWANSPNRGGTWATLAGDHIFVSAVAWQPDQAVRLGESSPHRADSVAALTLRSGKEEWPWAKALMEFTDEWKLPRWRSQVGHGVFSRQRVVFHGQRLYALGNGHADAFELRDDKTVKHLWRAACPRVYSEALAANALLIGSQDRILALDPETGKTIDDVAVRGQVRGLAISGGRIHASTERGEILALAAGVSDAPRRETPPRAGQPVNDVAEFLRSHGLNPTSRGFAVVADDRDTRLAQAIAEATELHVVCILPTDEAIRKERDRLLDETALYGSRVVVSSDATDGRLPFVSTFANFVVVSGGGAGVQPSELYRVLRPCGGRMLFRDTDVGRFQNVAAAGELSKDGRSLVRGKLAGAFDWNSRAEADQLVRWPLEFQWFGDPGGQLVVSRHSRPRTPIPANGRLFVFGESHLTAIDAYNGAELWRRRLSVPVCTGMQPVSADDEHVYITDGSVVWQLDAGSGAIVKVFGARGGPTVHSATKPLEFRSTGKNGESGRIAFERRDGRLLATLVTESPTPSSSDRWELAFDFRPAAERLKAPGVGTFELVVDPWAGVLSAHKTFPHPAVAIEKLPTARGEGSVVQLAIDERALAEWIGVVPADFAVAADVKLWTEDFRLRLWGKPLAGERRGWINEAEAVVSFRKESPKSVAGTLSPFAPVRLESADAVPEIALLPGRLPPMTRSRPDGDYSGDFVEGLGSKTAKPKETMLKRVVDFELAKRRHPLTGDEVDREYSRSYGCSGTSCSAAVDFFRSGAIGLYDRIDDSGMRNVSGIRSGCGQTIVAAFGLALYAESTSDCLCSYSFATSFGLAPASGRRNEDWALFDDKDLTPHQIQKTAINFGAPGDRRDADGNLWLAYPRPALGLAKKTALPLPIVAEGASMGTYRINTDRRTIAGSDRSWIVGSGLVGIERLQLDLVHHIPNRALLSVATDKPPAIDGQFDDTCWDGFGALPLTDRNARISLRQDAERLYIAYEQLPPVDKAGKRLPWKASVVSSDGAFERDDHVRVTFLNAKGAKAVTFAVTAAGGKFDALLDLGEPGAFQNKKTPVPAENVDWTGAWDAKTTRDASAFRAEIAIPWKTLTDAGLSKDSLLVECARRTRWGGAKDAGPAKLLSMAIEVRPLKTADDPATFAVKLHFAELEDVAAGERVFDVVAQGKTVAKDFDVAARAGGRDRAVTLDFDVIATGRRLDVRFVPKTRTSNPRTAPIVSGIEVRRR